MWLKSAIILATFLSPTKSKIRPNEEAYNLQDDYFDWKKSAWPSSFYVMGFNEFATEVEDLSFDGFESRQNACRDFREKSRNLVQLLGPEMDPREMRNVQLVGYEANLCSGDQLSGLMNAYFAPINFMDSIQNQLPSSFVTDGILKLDNLEDHKKAIQLMKKIPKYLGQMQILLESGVKHGITYANESMWRVQAQFETIQVPAEDSDFYAPFKKLLGSSSAVEDVKSVALQVIANDVLPAFKKLQDYIVKIYSKHLRKSVGVSELPDGEKFYLACLEYHTTLMGVTPEEVHNIGLDEVSRLKSEMLAAATKLGYDNYTFADLVKELQSDPEMVFENEQAFLNNFKEIINQIDSKLTKAFDNNLLNNDTRNVEVLPMKPGEAGLAYYRSPSVDGRRRGAFYINLKALKSLKKFEALSLTLHEANPGHNLQFSFNKHSSLPEFLRNSVSSWEIPGSPPSYSAHVEGWGLYSEYLGNELDLFKGNSILGYYSFNLLRACRLVVDTGLHVLGWSRQRAVDYLVHNTALGKPSIEVQIDRYITWPGQATAYKMGERHIRKVRANREKALGSNFNLADFHKHVLNCLGPLYMLEECVEQEESLPPAKKRPKRPKKARKAVKSNSSAVLSSPLFSFCAVVCHFITQKI